MRSCVKLCTFLSEISPDTLTCEKYLPNAGAYENPLCGTASHFSDSFPMGTPDIPVWILLYRQMILYKYDIALVTCAERFARAELPVTSPVGRRRQGLVRVSRFYQHAFMLMFVILTAVNFPFCFQKEYIYIHLFTPTLSTILTTL